MWSPGKVERGGEACVLARGGLPAGCVTQCFSPQELLAALETLDARPHATIMVEREGVGVLAARGGASAALAAAAARPARHRHDAGAELRLRGGPDGWRLVLAVTRPLAPLDELRVWPDRALSAAAGLTPLPHHHIGEGGQYSCLCSAQFPYPGPLAMHRYLQCAPPAPRAFLRRLLAALPPRPPQHHTTLHCESVPLVAEPRGAAALEALCAAWGARPGAGHVCLYCGKIYSRRYGLKIHIRTHTGYKPLRCPHCARRFGDPSNLNKHVRLHAAASAAAARHRCDRCGVVAARRRDLERHARARHPSPG